MNKLQMYQIIIRILTCPILRITVPSYGCRRYQERETAQAVAMDLIIQLSTYIYVYVDNYQNKIYFLKIMKLFLP